MAGDLSKMLDADPNMCNIKMSDLIKPKTDGYAAVYTDKENFESKNADAADELIVVAQNKYGKLGSVYKSILKHLLERGGWRRKKGTVGRFHLIFGEAQGRGIPWKKFSQCFKYDYGIKPLVNYCRGLKDLSSKATMVKTIRSYCERKGLKVDTILPETHIFYPAKPEASERSAFERAFDRRAVGFHRIR